jgi:hypothetical protein
VSSMKRSSERARCSKSENFFEYGTVLGQRQRMGMVVIPGRASHYCVISAEVWIDHCCGRNMDIVRGSWR